MLFFMPVFGSLIIFVSGVALETCSGADTSTLMQSKVASQLKSSARHWGISSSLLDTSDIESRTNAGEDEDLPPPDSSITLGTGAGGCDGKSIARLDMYDSASTTDTTVLVVPGGAYMKISTDAISSVVPEYIHAGYRVAVLYYRLPRSTEKSWILCADPKQPLADITAAFDALRNDKISGSIVITGYSAGSHLAAHYSTTCAGDACPSGVVLHFPWLETGAKVACGQAGQPFANNPLIPTDGSQGCFPTDLVTQNTPPTVVYHATGDTTSLVAWSVAYVEALSKAGVKHAFYEVSGGGHYLVSFSSVVDVSDGTLPSDGTWASLVAHVLNLPSPGACTECDDRATPYMNSVGKSCAESSYTLTRSCNIKSSWTTNGYCQQSCFDAGLSYAGVVCCPPPPSPECAQCDNEATTYMKNQGLTCESWDYVATACQSDNWINSKQYCRKRCDELDHGYSGFSPCC